MNYKVPSIYFDSCYFLDLINFIVLDNYSQWSHVTEFVQKSSIFEVWSMDMFLLIQ